MNNAMGIRFGFTLVLSYLTKSDWCQNVGRGINPKNQTRINRNKSDPIQALGDACGIGKGCVLRVRSVTKTLQKHHCSTRAGKSDGTGMIDDRIMNRNSAPSERQAEQLLDCASMQFLNPFDAIPALKDDFAISRTQAIRRSTQ